MLIGVLERRSEIGLRRSLGAAKGNIRTQFLAEAVLLSLLGGAAGVTAGAISTVVYASTKHWTAVVPTSAWARGLAAAILIGAIADDQIDVSLIQSAEGIASKWVAANANGPLKLPSAKAGPTGKCLAGTSRGPRNKGNGAEDCRVAGVDGRAEQRGDRVVEAATVFDRPDLLDELGENRIPLGDLVDRGT